MNSPDFLESWLKEKMIEAEQDRPRRTIIDLLAVPIENARYLLCEHIGHLFVGCVFQPLITFKVSKENPLHIEIWLDWPQLRKDEGSWLQKHFTIDLLEQVSDEHALKQLLSQRMIEAKWLHSPTTDWKAYLATNPS